MINLSELSDLLTLTVVYNVINLFLKTFTFTRNDFKMSENFPKIFLRWIKIIIGYIYTFCNLIFFYNIMAVFFVNFASSTKNYLVFFVQQEFFWSWNRFTYPFFINWYKRFSEISLEISFQVKY